MSNCSPTSQLPIVHLVACGGQMRSEISMIIFIVINLMSAGDVQTNFSTFWDGAAMGCLEPKCRGRRMT